ncbi:hypothetical protein IB276_17740 [Ensifer sp. ENS04]|uniref:hypothetical protein n=1 Tax=Ensifer sp. ENS04 TaxID=2769281 RepID=UPI001780CB4A|nr:hypothetical protein [Ensifer sp. ENS04]MBD9541301.1 hypothetical protein [Ensifer sp. ENS04]
MEFPTIQTVFTEGVTADFIASDEQIEWWSTRFRRLQYRPQDVCEFLLRGVPGSHVAKLTAINPERDYACVELYGYDEHGQIFESGRSVEFSIRQVHLNMSSVTADWQGRGVGSRLAANCYRLARMLDFGSLGVTAMLTGSYTWARAGFLPAYESWNAANCKGKITNYLGGLRGVDATDGQVAREALEDDEPEGIWSIADLESFVLTGASGKPEPLRKALLIGSGSSWKGTMEFDGHYLLEEQLCRARSYLRLKPNE